MISRQVAGEVADREGLRLVPSKREYYLPEITDVRVADTSSADSVHVNFGPNDVNLTALGKRVVGTYGIPLEVGGVRLTVTRQPPLLFATFHVVSRSQATALLLDNFRAVPRPKTDIIDLSFTASEPNYAKRVVNAMALTFQQHNTENAQQTSRRRRVFLEEQMKQTDSMLQVAMAAYSGYRTGQQVFSSREKASAQQLGIVNVDIRRADLDAQRRTFRNLLSQAQRSTSSEGLRALVSAPGIAANPVVQQLYGQLTQYETQRDSMVSSGNAATHPDLIAMNSLISQNTNRLMAAVRSQLSALDAQIEALDDLKKRSTAEIASAPEAETEEGRLAQQVEAVQKMSDKLQEEYQKARMSEAVEAGQVEIVDLAEVPTSPIAAGRARKIALGLIVGIMLGVGTAVLIDGMNTSIRRRDDLERVLQVPGLAVIPRFVSASPQGRLAKVLPSRRNGHVSKSQRAEGLVTVNDARSSGAEAYRTLRTNLIFSQAVQTLRTIVVTSPSPSEGKTTTAANLAVSFAQQGMRVLIVDCDLRRSRLHRMFSVPREPGITELVVGQIEQEAAIRETAVSGLYVLPSGQLPPNPAELLGGDRMRRTLAKLGEAFDLIVLDTPPLLAASDAAILATQVDGVVVVVRAGVTESEAAQQAMQQLSSVGARVVGAVLNDPDSKLQAYGGYYNYEYASEA
jgi:tyrosine-protein kinase Etk/Wzc